MTPVGVATHDQLQRLAARGVTPSQAHDAIRAEAYRRFPAARAVILQPRPTFLGGFDIFII